MPMGVIKMAPRKTKVGELQANQKNMVPIVLKNTGDASLKVSRIYSKKFKVDYFNCGGKNPKTISAGESLAINLPLQPKKTGRFLDIILIFSDARNDIGKGYKGVLTGKAK